MKVQAQASEGRLNGLDTLRALAISLVYVYHYRIFVSPEPDLAWVSAVGWVGVDLFFVLSGYLIGNQLLRGLAEGQPPPLRNFYARRALRTWPVYWLVLAAYFSWPEGMGGRTPPPLWTFLSFTQNWQLQPGTAFSHAWSLCIEEQFYLVLPLVLWAGLRLRLGRTAGWVGLLALIGLGMAARAVLWKTYGLEAGGQINGYHPNIYYASLCRFDELLPGVAVAMLKHFHPQLWARITRHGQAVLALGSLATALMWWGLNRYYYLDGLGYGWFMTTFGYSLMAMAFAVLVVAALCPGSWLSQVRVPGALPLALWSYSIYLSHKALAHVLQAQLAPLGVSPAVQWLLVTLACVAVGAALFHAVERPVMRWRDRHVPAAQ